MLENVGEQGFPREAREQIYKLLRRSTPWATAKDQGKSFVPRDEPTQACNRLLEHCGALGLFVVEIGKLEEFVRSVGRDDPRWVNAVLERKDLANDPELRPAHEFVAKIMSFNPPSDAA